MLEGLEIGGEVEIYRAIVADLKRLPHQKALCDREAITCAASLERAP
jgi:putative ubiquitin-RnfH superfamily antitoxin RatB of RatAB toxin-antitoxin module